MEPKKRGRPKLETRHTRFCREYIIDLNASAAAKRAGYSAATAPQIANRLMADPRIHEEISRLMGERVKRTEITQDMVIKELGYIAFGRASHLMKWGPNGIEVKPSEELSDEEIALVAEISETVSGNESQNRSIKLKCNDRLKALELLGRHLGMFKDKVEQSGSMTLVVSTNVNGGEG